LKLKRNPHLTCHKFSVYLHTCSVVWPGGPVRLWLLSMMACLRSYWSMDCNRERHGCMTRMIDDDIDESTK